MSRVGWVARVRTRRKAGASDLLVWERAARTCNAIRVAPSLRLGFIRSREFEAMADGCFPASGDTFSFQVFGPRIGVRFVCSRVAISSIAVTAGTREKSSSFSFEFATKTPDVAHNRASNGNGVKCRRKRCFRICGGDGGGGKAETSGIIGRSCRSDRHLPWSG
jgi:hypothetical protein